MQKRQSAWERFTWLDGCLLLPAVATGVYQAISSSVSLTGQPAAPEVGQTVLLSLTLINAVSLGGMYAGPLVLGCHFIFRKRRQCLLPGEWLWLSPLIMAGLCKIIYGSVMAFSSSNLAPFFMYYMFIGARVQLSLIALCILCAIGLRTIKRRTTFRWTEYLGCFICILNGVFDVYCLFVFPFNI